MAFDFIGCDVRFGFSISMMCLLASYSLFVSDVHIPPCRHVRMLGEATALIGQFVTGEGFGKGNVLS